MEISNHLMFAGMDAVELAKKYGTPLYVYDVNKIREMREVLLMRSRNGAYLFRWPMPVKHSLL